MPPAYGIWIAFFLILITALPSFLKRCHDRDASFQEF